MSDLKLRRLKQLLDYDPETGVFRWRAAMRLNSIKENTPAGNIDHKGYSRIWIDGRFYKAHRLAWFYVHGCWPPEQIDHRNGVKSDNRIENLRLASNAQNTANKHHRSDNSAGYKGVWPVRGKWRAEIVVRGKRHYLGYHASSEQAFEAYRRASVLLVEEFSPYPPAPPPICVGCGN